MDFFVDFCGFFVDFCRFLWIFWEILCRFLWIFVNSYIKYNINEFQNPDENVLDYNGASQSVFVCLCAVHCDAR